MDLYKLKTFKAVAALLNFNQAAKFLNCAQSTVSGQIKSLEEEVGELLFRRVGKRIQLTSAGEKMVGYANTLLAIEKEAMADITGKKRPLRRLSLRAPEALIDCYFPNLIHEILIQHPKIDFDISNCLENNIENELQIENADLTFLFSDYISSANLITEKIDTEKLILTARPDHPLSDKKRVDASDLHGETLFFPKTGCGYGLPFRQLLNTHIVRPASIIEMTSIEAIKKCVKSGMGLTILPESSIHKEIKDRELAALNWISNMETPVLMVWHKDKKISEPLKNFMQLARKIISGSGIVS